MWYKMRTPRMLDTSQGALTTKPLQEVIMADLDYTLVNDVLKYDAKTGKLFWKERPVEAFLRKRHWLQFNKKYAGKEAGSLNYGYVMIYLCRRKIGAHRLAWLLHTGSWPNGEVDHINGNASDNRIENLRDVSHFENSRNQKRPKNNTSGALGVVWHKQHQKWCARIKRNGKYKHIGLYSKIDDAIDARRKAEAQCGFHPNHGR